MTWSIGLSESRGQHPLIVDYLTARTAWKRLSKPARAAVVAAYPDGWVEAHPNTLAALTRHGFIEADLFLRDILTPAGRAVAKWHVT